MVITKRLMLARARWILLKQLHFRSGIEVAGVSLIGIDMNFEFASGIGSYEQVFQHYTALMRFNSQLHKIFVLHAIAFGILQAHVNMASGANHALLQLYPRR